MARLVAVVGARTGRGRGWASQAGAGAAGLVGSGLAAGMGGGGAGAMGTSGLCLKSCKHFGVKDALGVNLCQRLGGSGQRMAGGLGKDCIL